VLQAAVGWWYANNLLFLWFGAIGLGTAYYMIHKVIGRPVYSYHLAAIGFWSYALFSSWTGMQRLVDGPFPAWMVTTSIAATILTLIPVATVGLNHHMTMQGYFPLMRYSPTLRFTVFGAMSYTVFSLVGILISLRSVARYVNFTEASIAYSHLGLYAFFTMVIFGSMYYIVPRLIGREWRYGSLIKLHFWASAYGIGLMTLMLLAGGFLQGASMENPSLAFSESVESVLPYLRGRSLAGILLTVSHFIFAYHFGLMLFGLGRKPTVPTFLTPVEAEGAAARLEIIFSNDLFCLGRCAWARTLRTSGPARQRNRRVLRRVEAGIQQAHQVARLKARHHQRPSRRLRARNRQELLRRLNSNQQLLRQRHLRPLQLPLHRSQLRSRERAQASLLPLQQ